MDNKLVVCVTGGSGFIGSCLVQLLLERGYTVNATLRNLNDEKETKHLQGLEGAASRLRLFQIDLLHYDSILAAIRGCHGCTDTYENFFMGSVHVKDVALAHLLVYENKSASGRHLCVEAITHYGDFAAKVAELYPEYKVPRLPKDTQPGLLRADCGSSKLMELGMKFIPMEQIIRDSIESLRGKGHIS
uniref:NAD(P)-binding domain-containing protein n=2 Tax=Kalanchoe fedtschenkoi TaxID=63787 RepID=A0A7N1A3U1_KALFE